MKTETVEEFLKRGGKVQVAGYRRAKGTEKYRQLRGHNHMGRSQTHVYWSEEKPKLNGLNPSTIILDGGVK